MFWRWVSFIIVSLVILAYIGGLIALYLIFFNRLNEIKIRLFEKNETNKKEV